MCIIHGEGPIPADIALVGEAPGAEEITKKRPFVGTSGRLLRELMISASVYPQMCYITNVIKERPPSNDITKFINIKKKIESEEYKRYLEILKMELQRINPKLIIAIGNVSLYALTGLQGITKYRGSILESTLLPGKKVIPILHPASALRQYLWRHHIRIDLHRAREQGKFREILYRKRDLQLDPTHLECLDYCSKIHPDTLLAFDIEIVNEEVSHISFATTPDEGICIPFYDQASEHFNPEQELEIWISIAKILEDPNIPKVAHNTVFDTSFLFEKYGIKSRNVHDTMIAHAILYPDFPRNLAFLTSIYTDIPYYKDEGKERFRHGIETSTDAFRRYSALDSVVLAEIFPQQVSSLKEQGLLDTYEHQRSLIEPILYMSQRGIRIDTEGIKTRSDNISVEVKELQAQLDEITGGLNPNSPKQCMEYFYGKKKIRPYTHKGSPTVNEKALKRISGRGFPEATKILQIRGLKKLKSTYLDVKLDKRNRLRYSINPVGTRFGRLSSGKDIFGRGTNVQNLPTSMRAFLQPDEGYVAYEADLSQAENRVVAYLGNEIKMIQAFEHNEDIHSKTASLLFGIPPETISALHKEWVEKGEPADPKYCPPIGVGKHDFRYWGKRTNHALNYDMSHIEAALQWEIPPAQAKILIDKYHRSYPGVRHYHQIIQGQMRKNRTLENLFGRRYHFMDRLEPALMKKGYSFVAQSTIADKINRHGLLPLYYNPNGNPTLNHVEVMAQIHDSIIIQIPIHVGWQKHAIILRTLRTMLMTPLVSWHGREFIIPTEIKMLPRNMSDSKTIKAGMSITASRLENMYKQLEYA